MKCKNIDGGKAFDWSLTSQEYARYRDIYPPRLYERLRALGVAADGTSWLDLGTGTGILPQNLYNPNAAIFGVDIAEEQIRYAKSNAAQNGWTIHYLVSPAESTGLPDHSFDCITAAQCFWYFDREAMQAEIKRLLKPGGIFIKIYMDWCAEDAIAGKSIALVKQNNQNWDGGIIGEKELLDDLFDGKETESFFCELPFTRESWHGRMCACRGTLASMDKAQFAAWREAHLKMLQAYPEAFTVKHKVYITYFILP